MLQKFEEYVEMFNVPSFRKRKKYFDSFVLTIHSLIEFHNYLLSLYYINLT